MGAFLYIVELGDRLSDLVADQADWSQRTFGSDQARGPLGALRHLEKEAREAQETPDREEEYADCFLLIVDAARRAGIKVTDLIKAAQAKMIVNRQRQWPTPVDDQPVEHVQQIVGYTCWLESAGFETSFRVEAATPWGAAMLAANELRLRRVDLSSGRVLCVGCGFDPGEDFELFAISEKPAFVAKPFTSWEQVAK